MKDRKLFCKAALCSLLCSAILCSAVYFLNGQSARFLASSLLGAACSILALRLSFATWQAAPNGGSVAMFYMLRLVVVFGSVLAAMFLPAVDALGILLPELFPVPVLAIFMALEDASKGEPKC